MKRKWLFLIIIFVILCVAGISVWNLLQGKKQPLNEIQPQEEMGEEQEKTTIVTLYYQNTETKELMPEGKIVAIKDLVQNPYQTLVELLKEKPKNQKLQSLIPKDTRVIKAQLQGDILMLDLSKEFVDNHPGGEQLERQTIYSIVNTLTELNEINGVKICINGKENQSFLDHKVSFQEAFLKMSL